MQHWKEILHRAMKSQLPSLPKKLIIIMCGLPGTGKTTTAHRIQKALHNTGVISRDVLREPYTGSACLDEFSNGTAFNIDQKFYAHTTQFLSTFTTVILDATFREAIKRQIAIDYARHHGCQALIIECICSYQVLLARLNRQMVSAQKSFIKPPEDILEYYIEHTQQLGNEVNGTSVIRLDTDTNQIVTWSFQEQTYRFAKRLIAILEQPLDADRAVTSRMHNDDAKRILSLKTRRLYFLPDFQCDISLSAYSRMSKIIPRQN